MNNKMIVLFSGHMIDAKDRKAPRFPAEKEQEVKTAIRKHLMNAAVSGDASSGIASGASGGDILFHELCEELLIPSEMYLALPVNEFRKESVAFAGPEWVERYNRLIKKNPVHILPNAEKNENVWVRNNIWMLEEVKRKKADKVMLIALWDGKDQDGDGGTLHMIGIAKKAGVVIDIIDLKSIVFS